MLTKRVFVSLTLLTVFALLLAACAPAATPAPKEPEAPPAAATEAPAAAKPITIQFWIGLGAPDNVPMENMVKQFNSENKDGITVEYTNMDWDTLYSKIVLDFKTGNAPDIATMHQTNIIQNVSLGILQPIDEIYKQAGIDASDFVESAWKGAQVDGKQYAIPNDMHPLGLYYNVDHFKAAGLDPEKPPTNKEEFLEYARKLTDPAKGQYGVGLGYTGGVPFRIWMSLIWQHKDQDVLNADRTKAAFNTPAGIDSLQLMYDLVYKEKVNPQAEQDFEDDFKKGIVSMVIDGPWSISDFNTVESLHYKTAMIPVIYDQPAAWANSHTYVFPDNKKPEATLAAMKFAKWMSDHNFEWSRDSGHQPVRISVINSPEFKQLVNWQPFAATVPVAHYYPATVKQAEVFGRQPTSPFVVMMESVMLDKVAVPDAIATAEKAVNEILAAP
ncbi:MAG: hypothetical protein B6D39_04815 [Anaerolineae bacterium UTCFX2]|jgi:multiple sugar transport system substrate-binding protein|nr:ABC transporter substrate-binding protein [Anaerolineae bacterium]MCZ7551553.1 ABC transporter substrate-binding protein [Anaerolineales bacterium]OQY92300.1 MAG: hypothetical protein B6D39_04815 [Anaerolineae bacterium UTCFX2]